MQRRKGDRVKSKGISLEIKKRFDKDTKLSILGREKSRILTQYFFYLHIPLGAPLKFGRKPLLPPGGPPLMFIGGGGG